MADDDARIQQLLDELLDSDATPEEVCRSCPELLPEVCNRWRRMCRLRADLDALFPPPDETVTGPPAPPPADTALPRVPGYAVEAVLGRGGMGVVFRARHLRLNRTVALKMLLGGAYAGRRERDRFQREAEAVAGLRHPNVVQIYDIGDVDGRPYFTMELVEGGSLARKLAGTPQPAREAAQLLATLAGAVQAAHACGVVHRDLKPANVLLTADGAPKVSDFGIARRLGDGAGLTQTGVAVGTPSYMAPEQARGQTRAIGPAADVYALGAILYESLTGRPPFKGETPAETVHQVVFQDPVPPSRLVPRVPRDLETICLKCLQKEPGRRYAAAADLAADLGRFLGHEPIRARPTGRVERGLRWVRRRPAAAGLLAAAALLVAAGVAAAWSVYQQRTAAHARQAQTDQEVRGVVERACVTLDEGWDAAEHVKLSEAQAEGTRAVDIARRGGASASAQQEAEGFLADAAGRLERARRNRELRDAVLDVSAPRDAGVRTRDGMGRVLLLPQPDPDEQYAAAFRRWGLDVDHTAEAEVVARLRQEPDVVVQELIAGLDAWMKARREQKRPAAEWRRLARVADQLDRDDRRRRLRALLAEDGPSRADAGAVLREVRGGIDPRREPVLTVLLLSRACAAAGDLVGAEEVLRRAAAARPDDVVLLTDLGNLLEGIQPPRLEAAIGYYRAARGQRTHVGIVLSRALLRAGLAADAADVLQELLPRQPDNPELHVYLGVAAFELGKPGEAVAAFRKPIELQPDFPEAYADLGMALGSQQADGEAEAALRKALALRPVYPEAYNELGLLLHRLGRRDEAEAAFRKATDLKPDYAEAHNNIGNMLRARGRPREAEAAYRRAIASKPDHAVAHYNLGTALYDQQRLDEAAAALRTSISFDPNFANAHYNLGMALMRQVQLREAEVAFGRAAALYPEGSALREQAGRLHNRCQRYQACERRLPAVLAGMDQVATAEEHADFAQLLQLKRHYATSVSFFVKAFAMKPQMVAEPRTRTRYRAATIAALAGSGQGVDEAGRGEAERARCRAQAREWLRADLDAWAKKLDGGLAADRAAVREALTQWRADPELAGLRDPAALDQLPPAERQECRALWGDLDALLRRARPPQ
jgi:serine/threonine-protein kinase